MCKGLISGFLAVLLMGCSFFPAEREYAVALPALSVAYEFIESWDVEVLSFQSGLSDFSVQANGRDFTLKAGREEELIVMATPRGPAGFSLKPAALYLDGLSGDSGLLSFESGPAGAVLRRVYLEGGDLRLFNVSRFFSEFTRGEAESPWFLDLDGLVRCIGQGEMALYRIRLSPQFSPGTDWEGEWISDDTFLGAEIPPRLPAGRHRFYDPVHRRIREIQIGEDGAVSDLIYSVKNG